MSLASRERRDDLIAEYRDYVQHVVGYLIQSMGLPNQLFDDFVSAGYLGLVEAAERFDFSSGYPFKNFAFLRIRGAVIDSIRQSSELSGKAYRYAKALQASDEMRQDCAADGKFMHDRPAMTLDSVMEYAARSIMAYRLVIGADMQGVSTAGGYGEDPETQLSSKQSENNFRDLIATLPEKERIVIEEYYFNDRTFAEIAEAHEGFSKSWVCRLHARALARLHQTAQSRSQEAADLRP